MDISQHSVIALVVDRKTGRVIDAERYTYGPYLTELVQNHDLTQYDIILRAAQETQPKLAVAGDYEAGENEFNAEVESLRTDIETPPPTANVDEDISF